MLLYTFQLNLWFTDCAAHLYVLLTGSTKQNLIIQICYMNSFLRWKMWNVCSVCPKTWTTCVLHCLLIYVCFILLLSVLCYDSLRMEWQIDVVISVYILTLNDEVLYFDNIVMSRNIIKLLCNSRRQIRIYNHGAHFCSL